MILFLLYDFHANTKVGDFILNPMFGLHFSFSNSTKYENGYLDVNKQITPKFFQISALIKYIFDF